MSRFDIYATTGHSEYAIDVQSEFVDFLPTRLVIPLLEEHAISKRIPAIHLPIVVNGKTLYTVTNMMAAVPARQLRKRVGSAAHLSYDITSAIDFLLQGF